MKDLIRKILKESIDEFDWVDYNPNLYDLISNLLKHEHPEYWLERFSDETGSVVPMEFLDNSREDYNIAFTDQDNYYFSLNESEFTIENIRKQLQDDIINLKQSKRITVMHDYINLAKALEPIIGPLNYHDSLAESIDEFDWIEPESNLAQQFLYDKFMECKLEPVKNKEWLGWTRYVDKNGKILFLDNIETGNKDTILYFDYFEIYQKLEKMGLNYEEMKKLCIDMLYETHKRKVLTTWFNYFLRQ